MHGGSGSSLSADSITIGAREKELTLAGTTTYLTAAELFGSKVTLNGGSNSIANQPSVIYTGTLDVSLGVVLTVFTPPNGGAPNDTWTIINGGTYANDPGNITLTGPLKFGDPAIIASGNITVTGGIDLSGSTGGDLTMLAGYNFTRAPAVHKHLIRPVPTQASRLMRPVVQSP